MTETIVSGPLVRPRPSSRRDGRPEAFARVWCNRSEVPNGEWSPTGGVGRAGGYSPHSRRPHRTGPAQRQLRRCLSRLSGPGVAAFSTHRRGREASALTLAPVVRVGQALPRSGRPVAKPAVSQSWKSAWFNGSRRRSPGVANDILFDGY